MALVHQEVFGDFGDMCGFTPSDDLERVGTALKGPALDLVRGYLENPDNLDVVMNSLHQHFGQSWILIEAAYDKVSSAEAKT